MIKIAMAMLSFALVLGGVAMANVGGPQEVINMPDTVEGTMTLRLYSYTQQQYIQTITNVRSSDVYDFTVPAWDQWYWVGVWRDSDGELVLSMWIGHIRTN